MEETINMTKELPSKCEVLGAVITIGVIVSGLELDSFYLLKW